MGRGRNQKNSSRSRRTRLTRRNFLEAAAATAAGAALIGCGDGGNALADSADANLAAADAGSPPDALAPDAAPIETPDSVAVVQSFGLGVASGDVTHERAILWTRYDGTAALRLAVWEMQGEDYVRLVNQRDLSLDDDDDDDGDDDDGGFLHVDVYGLGAGREHRFVFFEMDGETRTGRSEIGHLRAALAPAALEPLLFGVSSCSNNGRSFATLEHAGARRDLDAHILLGDTVYADRAKTLSEYRANWAENLSTKAYLTLRASTSVICTWDDHEIDNDFDAESVPANELAAGTQAFFENLPLRRQLGARNRVWKSLRWGDTAEIFAIDCRSERKPSTRGDDDEQYISTEQMVWLKQALSDSTAVFKLILNTVPVSDFPSLFDAARTGRWEGYPSQRAEILNHIDDHIDGVLWLAGDFHLGCVGRVDNGDKPGATQIEALCGPAGQTPNPLSAILNAPQFDWATATNNYTTVALEPSTRTVTLTWIDGAGETLHTQNYTL